MAKATTSKKKVAKKRTRNSQPLYATITLGKLKELLGNKDKEDVVVSRNFVLALKKDQLEQQAAADLGI